jgi:hypothetical protein
MHIDGDRALTKTKNGAGPASAVLPFYKISVILKTIVWYARFRAITICSYQMIATCHSEDYSKEGIWKA